MVAGATMARKKQEKGGRRGPTYPKVLSYFEAIGHCNPPQAAKFEGGVSNPEVAGGAPQKRRDNEAPCKKACSRKGPFLFWVDCKRARAAEHTKAKRKTPWYHRPPQRSRERQGPQGDVRRQGQDRPRVRL